MISFPFSLFYQSAVATNDYTAALRQGRRSYRAALTKGEYPYLPVLDEIMSYTEVAGMENIGVAGKVQIHPVVVAPGLVLLLAHQF